MRHFRCSFFFLSLLLNIPPHSLLSTQRKSLIFSGLGFSICPRLCQNTALKSRDTVSLSVRTLCSTEIFILRVVLYYYDGYLRHLPKPVALNRRQWVRTEIFFDIVPPVQRPPSARCVCCFWCLLQLWDESTVVGADEAPAVQHTFRNTDST